jgi:hypothetical protein
MAATKSVKSPQAPPVYRPQPVPKALQRKSAITAPQKPARPQTGVIQPLLMYAYPSGVIFDKKKTTEEDAIRWGKVPVTHDGITVWTHKDNTADTLKEIKRQYETLKLLYGVKKVEVQKPVEVPVPKLSELDLVDEDRDVTIIHKGKKYSNCLIYKRKGWDLPSGDSTSLFVPGKLYCKTEQEEILPLTQEDINSFWTTEQYKSEDGYSLVSGADWRVNCAGYALNRLEDVDTSEAHKFLAGNYAKVGTLKGASVISGIVDGLETAREYVIALRTHFIKLFRKGENSFTTIEKSGPGPVYTKAFTKSAIKSFLEAQAEREALDELILYTTK